MRFVKSHASASLVMVLASLLIVSCGRKGPPTMKSFEKPAPVTDIGAVHREDAIIISWSYPAPQRETIKGFYIEKAVIEGQGAGDRMPEFRNRAFLRSDASEFTDKDFKAGGRYLYKLRAYSLRNVLGNESRIIQAGPSELPPPPAVLSYAVLNDSVAITWEKVPGNVLYDVYRSYEKGKFPASPLNRLPLKEPSYRDKVETERVSYYVVRSQLDAPIKDQGYPSRELEVNPGSFVPAGPVLLKFIQSDKKVYLMWNESPETWVKGYRVYRKRAPETEFRSIGESLTPAFTDGEPPVSKTFYFVTALGPKKESAPSEAVEVQPLVER